MHRKMCLIGFVADFLPPGIFKRRPGVQPNQPISQWLKSLTGFGIGYPKSGDQRARRNLLDAGRGSVSLLTVKTGQPAAVATKSSKDANGKSTTGVAGAVYRESMDGIALVVRQGDRIVSTYTVGKVPEEVQSNVVGK